MDLEEAVTKGVGLETPGAARAARSWCVFEHRLAGPDEALLGQAPTGRYSHPRLGIDDAQLMPADDLIERLTDAQRATEDGAVVAPQNGPRA